MLRQIGEPISVARSEVVAGKISHWQSAALDCPPFATGNARIRIAITCLTSKHDKAHGKRTRANVLELSATFSTEFLPPARYAPLNQPPGLQSSRWNVVTCLQPNS